MRQYYWPVAGAAFMLLVGCNGGSDSETVIIVDEEPPPARLTGFHVVDSYGISSEDEPGTDLFLNPYLYNGEFEVFWHTQNERDYTVEMRLNDRPVLEGSRLVSPDYCGPGLECDRDGIQFCNYFSDFSMSCDPPSTAEPGKYITYFDDWVTSLPTKLYLILDICDANLPHCEFITKAVWVE